MYYRTRGKSKYGNQKTIVDGITFDSRKEARRYSELKLLQKAHKIYDLQRQVRYELQPKFRDMDGNVVQGIYYVADFTYFKDGVKIIEDVKSEATRKDKVYLLKKKMMAYKGYKITEV